MKKSTPSLKMFCTKFLTSALYNGRHWHVSGAVCHMNSRDIRQCCPRKNKVSHKVRSEHIHWYISVNFTPKTIVTFTVEVFIILQLRNNEKNAHLINYSMAVKSCWHKIFQMN